MRALRTLPLRSATPRPILLPPSSTHSHPQNRPSSTTSSPETATASLSPRWLSDVKSRIGKCITFGLTPAQTSTAGSIVQELSHSWRELLCGAEGFLTSPTRRGLYRHRVVWGEQDAMGHVNNVTYNRYAESGRIEWVQKYVKHIDPGHAAEWDGMMTPRGEGLILRAIRTEYKFPMRYPDHVTVYHKLGTKPEEGMDSFKFDVVILSELNQRIAARCYEDCVFYDYVAGKKTAFKPFMLEALGETWKLQEEARKVNSERVQALLDRVRRLEVESWDREGAVEDMGTSQGR